MHALALLKVQLTVTNTSRFRWRRRVTAMYVHSCPRDASKNRATVHVFPPNHYELVQMRVHDQPFDIFDSLSITEGNIRTSARKFVVKVS